MRLHVYYSPGRTNRKHSRLHAEDIKFQIVGSFWLFLFQLYNEESLLGEHLVSLCHGERSEVYVLITVNAPDVIL